jgi:microcystin-dependent protein
MYQYDDDTAVAVEPTRPAPGTPGFYQNGDPGLGVPATRLDAFHLNAMMKELLGVLDQAGITPDKADDTQLAAAIVAIATTVASGAAGHVGEVRKKAGPTIPVGWLECAGAAVSRATYAALFAEIGTAWGVGDGSTTFNLPNFTDRFLVGRDAGTRDIGDYTAASLGELTITMEQATSPGSANDTGSPAGIMTDSGGRASIAAPIAIAEAGAPGSVLEPASAAVMFIIKT